MVTALSGALMALSAADGWATNICGSGTTTISTVQTPDDQCLLDAAGESLIVGVGGKISTATLYSSNNYPVYANSNNPTGFLSNSGTLSIPAINSYAVQIEQQFGGIDNFGLIESYNTGISLTSNSTIVGKIINHQGGTISGTTGIYVSTNSIVLQGIENAGTISARNGGGINSTSGSIAGGITNSGTISTWSSGAIYNYGGNFAGGITNTGLILSGSNPTRSGWAGVVVWGGGPFLGTS